MRTLTALSPELLARMASRLLYPAAGGRIARAVEYGVDMTLLVEQIRLSLAERASKLEEAATMLEQVRGVARRRS